MRQIEARDTIWSLNALSRAIGPFELNCEVTYLIALPGTDVADLAVDVIVPTLARNWIGDCLAKLVGSRRR